MERGVHMRLQTRDVRGGLRCAFPQTDSKVLSRVIRFRLFGCLVMLGKIVPSISLSMRADERSRPWASTSQAGSSPRLKSAIRVEGVVAPCCCSRDSAWGDRTDDVDRRA